MTQVSLPVTSRSSSDANDFQDVHGNDAAIVAVLNGDLRNDNIHASAGISHSKLASMATGAVLLGNSGTPTATTLTNAALGATGALTGVTKEALDATSVADKLGLSQTATVRRGVTAVATEQTTTSTSYTTLTTADEVASVVLPTNGLLFVQFRALWKLTGASNAGSAAIHLGANELKTVGDEGAPASSAVALPSSGTFYGPIHTSSAISGSGAALTADNSASGDSSLVTTGQVWADASLGGWAPVAIEADAGTYTVSIKYKVNATNGGTLSVKDRRLWVWTMGF